MTVEYYEPETVKLCLDDSGNKKWYLSTRYGLVEAGVDGTELIMKAEHFNIGTTIVLQEPIEDENNTD